MALFEWKNGTKVQNAVVASDGTTVQDAVWEGETPLSANNMNQAQKKMQDEYKGLIGDLNDLNTTEKSSMVNATNEVLGGLNGLITKSTSAAAGYITIGKIGIEWGTVSITPSSGYGAKEVNFQNTYKYAPCAIACAGVGTSQITNVGTFGVTTTSCSVFMTGSITTERTCRYLVVGETA